MRNFAVAGVAIWLIAAVSPVHAESLFPAESSRLTDFETLQQGMHDRGASELPTEALAYYYSGLDAAPRAGRHDDARVFLTQAAMLDRGFPEAHLALARVNLFRRPQSVPANLMDAIKATGLSFGAQHTLFANLVTGGLLVAMLGAMLIILYSLTLLAARMHHVMSELMRPWLPGPLSAVAAALLFVCPFLWKVGVFPALCVLAGLVWPLMRSSERKWTAAMVGATMAIPVVLWALSPLLFGPMNPRSTSVLMSRAMSSPYSGSLASGLREAIREEPGNGSLHFALGMLEKHAGHLDAASNAYKRSLENGGPTAAIHNNLGVIAYHRGDFDEAIGQFQGAVRANAKLASAHYNLSQAYAKKLYFEKSDEELREAHRLAFKRIRNTVKSQTAGVNGTLLDEPLPPLAAWREAWFGPRFIPGFPAWLSVLFPGTLLALPLVCVPLFGLGVLGGTLLQRRLPSYGCTNCGKPISRRCLRRIRKKPYCQRCGDALLQIQSAAYSRLALDSRFRRSNRFASLAVQIFNWLLPGYHAARIGRTHLAMAINCLFVLSLLLLVKGVIPAQRLVWLDQAPGLWWPEFPVALFVLTQGLSWFTVWKLHEEVDDEPAELDENQNLYLSADASSEPRLAA